ncbi:unnamed protein product [Oikopleura dioica]|uniref:Dynein heavy chain hydrolytic ATP-binding dynein motor region domain-containing protein n=1 Tax=Oikopleura dioica TaxID=34765 RepID=E4Z4T8_OIKDI|nr:unnamed protein product [Oikopleura dioica]
MGPSYMNQKAAHIEKKQQTAEFDRFKKALTKIVMQKEIESRALGVSKSTPLSFRLRFRTLVKTIQDAIKDKKERFVFEGEQIQLVPTVGIFITMNPGYAGRTELPENLKALFRPCAMVVPDFELIAENMLLAEGFLEAKYLAKKFITLYTLCRELLSKQYHYDWGLRAIKSVLVVAGKLKRGDRQRPEDQVLMRALRDFNVPKIVTDDMPIFLVLTLASNERIPLNPSMRLVFEISNLRVATPATVSRAGILFLNASDLGWNPIVTSWIETREVQAERANMIILFEKYVPPCLEALRTKFKPVFLRQKTHQKSSRQSNSLLRGPFSTITSPRSGNGVIGLRNAPSRCFAMILTCLSRQPWCQLLRQQEFDFLWTCLWSVKNQLCWSAPLALARLF